MQVKRVSNELLLEVLKKIQSDIGLMRRDMDAMMADDRGTKSHMAAFMQTEVIQDGAISDLRHRVDRIERRLELQD